MNREAQAVVLVLLGGVTIGVTVSGKYTAYVKPGFGPLLVIAGIALVVVGLATLAGTVRSLLRRAREARAAEGGAVPAVATDDGSRGQGDDHGHDHSTSRAPWLLLAPVLMLVAVAPAALGADAVGRNAGSQDALGLQAGVSPADAAGAAPTSRELGYAQNDGTGTARGSDGRPRIQFAALSPGENPPVTVKEFVLRALYDAENSVVDHPTTVIGFIAPAGDGFDGGYTIARLAISCCAADATPLRIHVAGDPPFPPDTWVSAVLTAVPDSGSPDNEYVPTATVHGIEQISQPSDPYEH